MMEMLKFGRRVVFDKQMSNRDVLERHLTDIHENSNMRRSQYDTSKQQEREYVDKRKRDDDLREAEKQFYNQQLRQEYSRHNQLEKVNQDINHMNAVESRNAEKADFFPFVSGELLEEHRKHLN